MAETTSYNWVDINTFRSYLTAYQINNPSGRNLYFLSSARIDFVPYQFRLALKLIHTEIIRQALNFKYGSILSFLNLNTLRIPGSIYREQLQELRKQRREVKKELDVEESIPLFISKLKSIRIVYQCGMMRWKSI